MLRSFLLLTFLELAGFGSGKRDYYGDYQLYYDDDDYAYAYEDEIQPELSREIVCSIHIRSVGWLLGKGK